MPRTVADVIRDWDTSYRCLAFGDRGIVLDELARLRAAVVEKDAEIARLKRAVKEAAAVLTPLAVVDGVIDVRAPREPPTIDCRSERRALSAAATKPEGEG